MSKEKEHILEEPEAEFSKKTFPIILPEGYASILETLTHKIRAAQARAMLAVNYELINVYGDIGKTIHEQLQIAQWGASVVDQLARDLKKSFPGVKGFSSRNLWRMKDFYQSYHGREKLSALLTEIS